MTVHATLRPALPGLFLRLAPGGPQCGQGPARRQPQGQKEGGSRIKTKASSAEGFTCRGKRRYRRKDAGGRKGQAPASSAAQGGPRGGRGPMEGTYLWQKALCKKPSRRPGRFPRHAEGPRRPAGGKAWKTSSIKNPSRILQKTPCGSPGRKWPEETGLIRG